MGKYSHKEVVNGRLTVTTIKRTREDGHHVYTEVYPTEEEVGEPTNGWVFPVPMIYDYSIAAHTAERQSRETK